MKKIILISVFLMLALSLFAQTNRQRLLQLSESMSQKFQAEKAEALRMADSLNLVVRQEFKDGQVIELMRFENNRPIYYTTYNAEGANLIKASNLYPGGSAGLGLTGMGQNLGMWDGGGTFAAHQEFQGRVQQMDSPSGFSAHATHVAGTMIARGSQMPARGMSFAGNLKAYDWNNDNSEMASAAANGMKVSNHSYGYITGWSYRNLEGNWNWYWYGDPSISNTEDYRFGFYDNSAKAWDQIALYADEYLIVKAAGNDRGYGPEPGTGHYVWIEGNWVWSTETRDFDGGDDGYDTISTTGLAKNILTVGAVNAQSQMSSFSGWGPTDDGRIKPDIVAKGVGVYSPSYNSATQAPNFYDTYNGTSMSSPMVSGAIGLLLQHQQNLNPGQALKASTMKGLIIHSADDMISGALGPDYRFGWGLMDTEKAAEIMSNNSLNNAHIFELTLADSQTLTLEFTATGDEPFKATIVWTDIDANPVSPALNPTNLMLVNDLDLRVFNEIDEFQPYILDPANPTNPATTGDNFRDNVEVVFIENPIPGQTYTVSISHKNNLYNQMSQAFSLIVTGNTIGNYYPAPQNLIAFAGNQIVDLQWNEIWNDDFTGYNLYRNNEIYEVNLTDNYYSDVSVTNGTTYTYYVTAVYGENESMPSNYVNATPFVSYTDTLPPRNLTHQLDGNNVILSWEEPGLESGWFTHSVGEPLGNGIGTDSQAMFEVAHRFTPQQLQDLGVAGQRLSKISYVPNYEFAEYIVKVWVGGQNYPLFPGQTIFQTQVSNFTVDQWNEVLISDIYIPHNQELWIGYQVITPGGFPAGADSGPAYDYYGNLIFLNNRWQSLLSLSETLNYNWLVKGFAGVDSENTVLLANNNQEYSSDKNYLISNNNLQASDFRSSLTNFQIRSNQQRNLTGYNIYRNQEFIAYVPFSELSYTDYEIAYGHYTYSVTAVYEAGESVPVHTEVHHYGEAVVISDFPWHEDFEGEQFPPLGWMVYDLNGDGDSWRIYEDIPNTGNNVVGSMAAFFAGLYITPDNWLITPKLQLPEDININLKYLIASDNFSRNPQNYSVLISHSSNNNWDFYPIYQEYVINNELQPRIVDLSQYAGQEVYIAFRHHNSHSNQISILMLDDVEVISSNTFPFFPAPPRNLTAAYENNSVVLNWDEPAEHEGDLIIDFAFTGNTNDMSGYNHHGISFGTTFVNDRFGNYESALSFNGFNDYVSAQTSNISYEQFAVSLWFKTTATNRPIIGNTDFYTGSSYGDKRIYLDNQGRIFAGVYPNPTTINTTESYNDNQWHHVVLTQNYYGISLYVNGELIGQRVATTTHIYDCQYWTIGYVEMLPDWPSMPSNHFFSGMIDDVKIYNKHITEAEVLDLYTNVRNNNVRTSNQRNNQDPSEDLIGYNVYKNGNLLNETPVTQLSYTDIFIEPTHNYYYEVTAVYEYSESRPIGVYIEIPDNAQRIRFTQGWNIFSANRVPESLDMMDIFDGLIENNILSKVQNQTGDALEYLLDNWVNNIGDISFTQGYRVRVNSTSTLNIMGDFVELPLSINLTEGWNIISYPHNYEESTYNIFYSLFDNEQIVKVMDQQGRAIEIIPYVGLIDNIYSLKPGQGYVVKATEDFTLTYSGYNDILVARRDKETVKPEMQNKESVRMLSHYQPIWSGNGFQHFNVYALVNETLSQNLSIGDEIAVFDGDNCVGATVFTGQEDFISVITSMNDGLGDSVNGFIPNNDFSIRIWLHETESEIINPAIVLVSGNNQFTPSGTSVIQIDNLTSQADIVLPAITDITAIYPNPFNPTTNIKFSTHVSGNISLEIYNIKGQKVKTLITGYHDAGVYQVAWNGVDNNNRKVSSGVYFTRLVTENKQVIRKMVLIK